MLSRSLNVFFLFRCFLISVKPWTTENTENKTTPKICKITVLMRTTNIARNVTGWPASRQARIFMKIELNSIKNRLSTGPRVGRARFRLLLAGNGPRVWSKTWRAMVRESWRKTGRCRCWWRYRKNQGTKNTPTVRYGSMSTVVQDLHGGRSRSSRRRHTTQRHRQQRWLRERPEEKQIVAVVCEVRETILFAKKYCHDTVGFVSICKTHTLTVSAAPRWSTVVAKTRCRLGRSAVHGWPAAMQISARLH